MNFFADTLQTVNDCTLYADIPKFKSPTILALVIHIVPICNYLVQIVSYNLYVVDELIVEYETNVRINAKRKKSKFICQLNEKLKQVKLVNFSMSSLGVFAEECSSFLDMLNDIGIVAYN